MKTPKNPSTTKSTISSAKKPEVKPMETKPKKSFDDDDDDDFDSQMDDLGFDELGGLDDDDDY